MQLSIHLVLMKISQYFRYDNISRRIIKQNFKNYKTDDKTISGSYMITLLKLTRFLILKKKKRYHDWYIIFLQDNSFLKKKKNNEYDQLLNRFMYLSLCLDLIYLIHLMHAFYFPNY